jgi:hypothetical protein
LKISEIKFHNYKIILQKVKELIDECDETAANDGTGKQRQTGLTPTKNHYNRKIVVPSENLKLRYYFCSTIYCLTAWSIPDEPFTRTY